jgi:transcriptional regulator with XRE-family HTH domain
MPFHGPLAGLGEGLKTLRKRRGLRQSDVAKALKTDHASISDWERDGNITAANLDRLLMLYQADLVTLGELLPASRAKKAEGGGGGRALDGLRQELQDALDRFGVRSGEAPADDEEESERESSSRRNDYFAGAVHR